MPRQLKPQSIGEYYDSNTHTTVEMFLDRNDHTFFAQFGPEKYYAGSKNELIVQLQKAVKEAVNIEWAPMIQVRRIEPSTLGWGDRDEDPPFVGFKVYRYHYGRLQDGTWVSSPWDTSEHLRTNLRQNLGFDKNKELVLPCSRREGGRGVPNTFFLPYDEETWVALNHLVENIRVVRRRLDAMLVSEDGIGQLVRAVASGMSTKMLGPGDDNG